jgi:hypothetical protein
MRIVRLLIVLLAAAIVLSPKLSVAQAPPKPGPEHEILKQHEGIWEATVNLGGAESKGTMTYKMDLGGTWLVSDFDSDLGGQKFRGKGLDTYDPKKKKYVGVWADSMETSPMITEGTYDSEKKTLTMLGEGHGMDGKPTRYKMTTEIKDKDTMVFTMSAADKDGKDQVMMTINYKRKG